MALIGDEGAVTALDFDNAAVFLQQAREADARGDRSTCLAALKLVAISLNLTDGPRPRMNTKHLQPSG